MSLAKNAYIDNEDFNNIKTRINNECIRRSNTTSTYYQNTFNNNNTPIIENKNDLEYVTYNYINSILEFFKKFNTFPGDNLLNLIYQDGAIDKFDIIYALNNLLTILKNIEEENFRANDDCNNACMGLCTNSCADKCTDKCTSCTGTCSGTCTNSCTGNCYTTCQGDCDGQCTGCSNTCLESCGGSCGGGCGNCDIICMSPNYNHL